jgi:hypothetical protein
VLAFWCKRPLQRNPAPTTSGNASKAAARALMASCYEIEQPAPRPRRTGSPFAGAPMRNAFHARLRPWSCFASTGDGLGWVPVRLVDELKINYSNKRYVHEALAAEGERELLSIQAGYPAAASERQPVHAHAHAHQSMARPITSDASVRGPNPKVAKSGSRAHRR